MVDKDIVYKEVKNMAIPKHYIFASNGSSVIYTFPNVLKRDPPIPLDIPNSVAISNLRGSGEITIPGGNQAYDITIETLLIGADYTALMTSLNSLKSTIVVNTNYYLKYDKTLTNNESLESIKVRLKNIQPDSSRGNLTTLCYVILTFRALSW